MKKVRFLFFIFYLLFFSLNVANASSCNCAYDFSYKPGAFDWTKDKLLVFTFDDVNNTITYPSGFLSEYVYFLDYYIDNKYTTEYIIENLNGGCPSRIVIGSIGEYAHAILFEESNLYQLKKVDEPFLVGEAYYLPEEFITSEQVLGRIGQVSFGEYNSEQSTCEVAKTTFGCNFYDETIEWLNDHKCKSPNSQCSSADIQEYNKKKDKMKSFCRNITQNANMGVSSCLTPCLDLSNQIALLEGDNDLGECGLSSRLVGWILNIVKWLKYIIPVVVIVLGILDFIKAMSSEKDDEMKKAQGAFIKRLIAAALIFLVPFIMEFILDKMGFEVTGCGIIKELQ